MLAHYMSSEIGHDVFFFFLPFIYMWSVKTRTLTRLSDRKETTRNGSATDVDVELFVA